MARSGATATVDPVTGSPAYPTGSTIDARGHVTIGGCDLVEVAREFGTPAYVYAPEDVRVRARAYRDALAARGVDAEVLYASKAAPFTALYRLIREEGLSVDVASGGELHMALAAGFDPARIYMHGNNKSAEELRMAFDAGIGCIVVDSLEEISRADWLADRAQQVLIRLTPGVSPSTHSYVQTGQIDSKFGFAIEGGQADQAIAAIAASQHLELAGFHAHLGSQIYELDPYVHAIEVMAEFCRPHSPRIMNVGGGLGIAYSGADRPPSIEAYVDLKVDALERCFDPLPKVLLEPGRSLVGNAGVTIYTVGAVKEIPGIRTYVAVDGGMSDNLRPMLYGSEYEALIANRAADEATVTSTVAGKHCESGDILVRDVALADPRPGDLLLTPATGAYGYAMANNYNGVPRPPVVFCENGNATLAVRRETYGDLVSRDV